MPAAVAHPPPVPPSRASLLDKSLRVVADVREGEGATALLLVANVFFLLLAYYLVKVAREPLILSVPGGAETKSYAALGQSLLLLPLTKAYALVSERVGRLTLVVTTTLFFAVNLLLFFGAARAGFDVAVPFFLWVGVFNYMIVTQFWSFAADIYTEEQGRRLLPVLGVGSSLGAVAGAAFARRLMVLGPAALMLVSALLLGACLTFPALVERREATRAFTEQRPETTEPLGREGGWALLVSDRYLLALGVLSLLVNAVNSLGEYSLDKTLVGSLGGTSDPRGAIGAFKADYLFWVNAVSVTLQTFAVSRIVKLAGVRRAMFVMPVISVLGYAGAAALPILSLFAAVKIAENALDYSLGNTVRQALWLVTSREAKYKTKAVVDTFLVRAGDVLSAGAVASGAALHLGPRVFACVNVALVGCWLSILTFIARRHAQRAP